MTAILLYVAGTVSGVTYYVDRSHVGPEEGTLANPFITVTNAMDALATTNAVITGNHTILVQPGTYTNMIVFNVEHSGSAGNLNTIRANGTVTLDRQGSGNGFYINAARYISVDGFRITGCGNGFWLGPAAGNTGDSLFQNLTIYSNSACAMYFYTYRAYFGEDTIRNCTIFGNRIGIDASYLGGCNIRDCIIVNNGGGGFMEERVLQHNSLHNNLFYANGSYNVTKPYGSNFNSTAEINGMYNCASNIVANPGFFDIGDAWDFKTWYTNSPCIGAGDSGGNLGAETSPTLVGTSNNTYYVNASSGNDANNGLTSGAAWKSLTNAAAKVCAGDTVYVAAGTYQGPVEITRSGSDGMQISFIATGEAIIDASGASCALFVKQAGDNIFDGFTFKNATDNGVTSCFGFSNRFESASISDNGQYGIDMLFSSANSIVNSEICSNTSYGVRFLYSLGNVIDQCDIYANTIGICLPTGSRTYDDYIFNSNIYQNSSHGVMAGTYCYGLTLINCTVYANGGDGANIQCATLYATNCIFALNSGIGVREHYSTGGQVWLGYNCFYNNTLGNFVSKFAPAGTYNTADDINNLFARNTNNIVTDPMLIDPPDDFKLEDESPCRDAGALVVDPTRDRYGNRRRPGTYADIGSYEWVPPPGSIVIFN